jgi:predicted AAA+ superfamily ATPase
MCLTIARVAERELDAALRRVPVVVLLGPRQSGKSTVVRRMAVVRGDAARYLDAGRPADERRLQAAASYLHAVGPGLVVIDDAYRVPQVFEAVREVIDERRARGAPSGQFVLVGGAASELLPHAARLGDRVVQVEMRPLLADEAGAAGVALDELWLRGGLPASVTVDGARS